MIAGRYRLEREIGRGGAGVVHLAHDELLDRRVAVKRIGLIAGTTADDVERAQREARLAAGVNHTHVVSVFDLIEEDDCCWLVMEHVDGRTLADIVASEGPLPAQRAAAILAQAADALVQAGKAGIVHRDVKPSNILVTSDDHAKLGDFGIARLSGDTVLTRTGMITGSPAYIAPEVASGHAATAASDVWSLGATLFHVVDGAPPYDVGDNVLGGLYRIVNDDPPRLAGDTAVARLLSHMMVKDPARRWPVSRVRDELRRIANDDPASSTRTMAIPSPTVGTARATEEGDVRPPPPSVAPVPEPRGPRGGVGWAAAVLALVLLAGLGAWLLWGDPDSPEAPSGGDRPGASSEGTPSREPTKEPTEQPTQTEEPTQTEDPTEEPPEEPSPSTAQPGTPAAMRAFVADYFSLVTSDPEATFAMLTPEFQAASGGYGSYAGFWGTIESATPRNIRADPRTLVTTYTIDYVTTSGRTTTEQGRLQLVRQGDRYLVAGQG